MTEHRADQAAHDMEWRAATGHGRGNGKGEQARKESRRQPAHPGRPTAKTRWLAMMMATQSRSDDHQSEGRAAQRLGIQRRIREGSGDQQWRRCRAQGLDAADSPRMMLPMMRRRPAVAAGPGMAAASDRVHHGTTGSSAPLPDRPLQRVPAQSESSGDCQLHDRCSLIRHIITLYARPGSENPLHNTSKRVDIVILARNAAGAGEVAPAGRLALRHPRRAS